MTPQDKLNQVVENIINKIEKGELQSWFKSWSVGLPKNFASNTFYNGFNILSLMNEMEEKGYKSNQWLTFNQIQKSGAKLRQGSKGASVFFFKPLEIEEQDEATGELVKKTIPMLKTFTVFNVDATDIQIGNQNEEIPDLNDFIAQSGAIIKTRTEAFYDPKNDYIGMPDISTFIDSANYGATLLHELSHWSGAEHRLNRNLTGKFGTEDYGKEELIAELSAAMLCGHFQINGDLRHAEYLQSWLKALKAEPKLLWKSASEAQKVFDYLIDITRSQEQAA
jgi:antirestriction protein ArdC